MMNSSGFQGIVHRMEKEKATDKDRQKLIDLIQRSLALKHKLKVHDSLPRADTHEEIALNSVSRWTLEDELHAIEQLIEEARTKSVAAIKAEIAKKGVKKKTTKFGAEE